MMEGHLTSHIVALKKDKSEGVTNSTLAHFWWRKGTAWRRNSGYLGDIIKEPLSKVRKDVVH